MLKFRSAIKVGQEYKKYPNLDVYIEDTSQSVGEYSMGIFLYYGHSVGYTFCPNDGYVATAKDLRLLASELDKLNGVKKKRKVKYENPKTRS